jgi:hypothetical protein
MENPKNLESKERGRNVKIVLKFMRHGERDLDGRLTDYGRKVTKEKATESDVRRDDFHAVKAIGSVAGESSGVGARALETADIYSHEFAGDEAFETRKNELLNYEKIVSPVPYNHMEIYNSYLPANFASLSDEEKSVVAKKAQTATVEHIMNLQTPEAVVYRKEIAGAFASIVLHYCDVVKRLYSGSRVLIPAGTHGGTMEMLLREALARKDENGLMNVGLTQLTEFNPSESYNVNVETDDNGDLKEISVTFDDPNRNLGDDLHLDSPTLSELSDFYNELHKEK